MYSEDFYTLVDRLHRLQVRAADEKCSNGDLKHLKSVFWELSKQLHEQIVYEYEQRQKEQETERSQKLEDDNGVLSEAGRGSQVGKEADTKEVETLRPLISYGSNERR